LAITSENDIVLLLQIAGIAEWLEGSWMNEAMLCAVHVTGCTACVLAVLE
jgi:hypothetical protein